MTTDGRPSLVNVAVSGVTAVITLNEPKRKNPLSDRMIADLTYALESPDVRSSGLVVLRGAGGSFSAGGDIRQFHSQLTADAIEQFEATKGLRELFMALEAVPAVTMAIAEGEAFGGGCGLVAACDMAVAADTAVFACPEIRLRAFPMVIAPALVRAMGRRATMGLAVSGRTIDSEGALALGLVNEIVPAGKIDEWLDGLIDHLSDVPVNVLPMGKIALRSAATDDYLVGLETGSVLRSLLFSSSAFHDGVQAFIDRPRRQ